MHDSELRLTQRDPVAWAAFLLFVIAGPVLAAWSATQAILDGSAAWLGAVVFLPLCALFAAAFRRDARGELKIDDENVYRRGPYFGWIISRSQIAQVAVVQPASRKTTYLVVIPDSSFAPTILPFRLRARIGAWSRFAVPLPGLPPTALLCPIPPPAGPEVLARLGFPPQPGGPYPG